MSALSIGMLCVILLGVFFGALRLINAGLDITDATCNTGLWFGHLAYTLVRSMPLTWRGILTIVSMALYCMSNGLVKANQFPLSPYSPWDAIGTNVLAIGFPIRSLCTSLYTIITLLWCRYSEVYFLRLGESTRSLTILLSSELKSRKLTSWDELPGS